MPDLQQVLELVNLARLAAGLDPLTAIPKGIRENSRACPIARAINSGAQVTASWVRLDDRVLAEKWANVWGTELEELGAINAGTQARFEVTNPGAITEFIVDFDNQLLPDFEATKDEAEAFFT